MKTRFLMLLAAVLLGSASAFAQSGNNEPLKGDVNGDGKVDVADIAAVIEIMKNGGGIGGETFYWYAGQTKPESIDGVPDVDDTNFTNNKWHTLGTATYISQTVTGGTAGTTWKVAVPTTKSFKFYDNTLTELDTTWDKQSTGITVNGVSYDIWISRGTGAKTNVYMKSDAQIYYTYIGTDPSYKIVDADGNLTPNAADNIASMPGVKTSTTKPTSITSAYPSGTEVVGNGDYVYIVAINSAFNKSDNTKYFKTHNGNDVAMDEIGTFTKDGETYKILSTRVKVSGIVVQ